jgi:hypothetical protein
MTCNTSFYNWSLAAKHYQTLARHPRKTPVIPDVLDRERGGADAGPIPNNVKDAPLTKGNVKISVNAIP